MKFRIVNSKPGRWGEGWQNGDIVDLDWNAAKVALEVGEIEIYEENSNGVSIGNTENAPSSEPSPEVKVDRPSPKGRRVRKAAGKEVRIPSSGY